jgi:hypothetical protein
MLHGPHVVVLGQSLLLMGQEKQEPELAPERQAVLAAEPAGAAKQPQVLLLPQQAAERPVGLAVQLAEQQAEPLKRKIDPHLITRVPRRKNGIRRGAFLMREPVFSSSGLPSSRLSP